MGLTTTQLSASSRAAYSADKPILLGRNVTENIIASTPPAWRSWDYSSIASHSADYTVSATNVNATDSTKPTYRAYDRKTNLQTGPVYGGSSHDHYSLIFPFQGKYGSTGDDPGVPNDVKVDTVAILNHNLGTLSSEISSANPLYVQVYIGSQADSGTRYKVAEWVFGSGYLSATDIPLVAVDLTRDGLGTATTYEQYSWTYGGTLQNGGYIQIAIWSLNGNFTSLPSIGEVVLGQRVQLLHQASVPYEGRNWGADVTTEAPLTGQFKRYLHSSGRRIFRPSFRLTTDKDEVVTWFEDHISYGQKPFLYMPLPSRAVASPYQAYWVALEDTDFSIERTSSSPFDYGAELNMLECAPYNSSIA